MTSRPGGPEARSLEPEAECHIEGDPAPPGAGGPFWPETNVIQRPAIQAADPAGAAGETTAVRGDRHRPRLTYISWAESCSRSDHTARELGGRSHMVHAGRFGSRPATVLLKYASQWLATSRILRRERPDVVFVMTPPLIAALPAFWYGRRGRGRVVLDAHTAAFLHPRWRRLQWLQRAMCRWAATTLVHNDHIASIVHAAGGHTTMVPDVPVTFPVTEPFARPDGFVVAMVCSFNADEPLAEMIEAARHVPDVRFFVTGNPRHLDPRVAASLPPNVRLTGFLSTEAYGGLLQAADVVLVLTTRDHTMLRAAYEAIYQGTPVIVSDWPLLRDAFPDGAVHVDNRASQIAGAVRRVRERPDHYRAGADRLRRVKLARWTSTRDGILARLAGPAAGPDARCSESLA
jgi:glycosyltransferase involved in cell wall biosynthesis